MEKSHEVDLRTDIVDSRNTGLEWGTSIRWDQLPYGGKCPVKDRQAPKINFRLVGYFCFPIRRTTLFSCTNIYEPATVEMGTLRWIRLASCLGRAHGFSAGTDMYKTQQWAMWAVTPEAWTTRTVGTPRREWLILPRGFYVEIARTPRTLPKH